MTNQIMQSINTTTLSQISIILPSILSLDNIDNLVLLTSIIILVGITILHMYNHFLLENGREGIQPGAREPCIRDLLVYKLSAQLLHNSNLKNPRNAYNSARAVNISVDSLEGQYLAKHSHLIPQSRILDGKVYLLWQPHGPLRANAHTITTILNTYPRN